VDLPQIAGQAEGEQCPSTIEVRACQVDGGGCVTLASAPITDNLGSFQLTLPTQPPEAALRPSLFATGCTGGTLMPDNMRLLRAGIFVSRPGAAPPTQELLRTMQNGTVTDHLYFFPVAYSISDDISCAAQVWPQRFEGFSFAAGWSWVTLENRTDTDGGWLDVILPGPHAPPMWR
jgi:hypothetical protein